jgi:hypothetical protein
MKTRFEKYVIPEPNSGCWLWVGSADRYGYGQLNIGGRPLKAHRISWEMHREPIPKGLFVLHKCDTPACVNPDHLFIGTKSDNSRDMFAKGRASRAGENHPQARLTWRDVEDIRSCTAPGSQIGRVYGIKRQSVSNIRTNKIWKPETKPRKEIAA